MIPQTPYARSGKVNIAYRVTGEGPLDLVYVPGWASHLELRWEEPDHARFLHRLASFSRLITFDKRGTGLSDRVPDDQLPSLEVGFDSLPGAGRRTMRARSGLSAIIPLCVARLRPSEVAKSTWQATDVRNLRLAGPWDPLCAEHSGAR